MGAPEPGITGFICLPNELQNVVVYYCPGNKEYFKSEKNLFSKISSYLSEAFFYTLVSSVLSTFCVKSIYLSSYCAFCVFSVMYLVTKIISQTTILKRKNQ